MWSQRDLFFACIVRLSCEGQGTIRDLMGRLPVGASSKQRIHQVLESAMKQGYVTRRMEMVSARMANGTVLQPMMTGVYEATESGKELTRSIQETR